MDQLIIPVLLIQCALGLLFIGGILFHVLPKPRRELPKALEGMTEKTVTPKKVAHHGGLPYGLRKMAE